MGHPNELAIQSLYAAFGSGDMATVDRLLADEVTWHAPGTAQHAGIRRGKAELYASMAKLADLTGGTLRSEVIVYDLRDGQVVEVWEHPADLHAMDAFFA